MTGDDAATLFRTEFRGVLTSAVSDMLNRISVGATTWNPFTGKEVGHEFKLLHDRFAATGLLDDAEFRAALAECLLQTAQAPFWAVLTSHDGSWLFDDGSHLELRLKDGPVLGELHGREHEFIPELPEW